MTSVQWTLYDDGYDLGRLLDENGTLVAAGDVDALSLVARCAGSHVTVNLIEWEPAQPGLFRRLLVWLRGLNAGTPD